MSNIQINQSKGNSISVDSKKRVVIKNGKEYPFLKKMRGWSQTMVNDTVYVDGFKLTEKGWKRTFWSFLHLIF